MNNQPSNSIYQTSLDIIIANINNCNLESVYAILKDGEVNLETKNKLGMTPLHVNYKNNN
jgi:hypothetical protein